jgi:hypothetical protein
VSSIIHFVFRLLGLNSALAWAGGGRGLGMLLGPVGSIIVVWTLSPEEQGTYYLFTSLVALRALFDLGASAAIAQMTPHARKNDNDESGLPEDEFIRVAVQWMNRIALGFAIVVGPGGLLYLHFSGQAAWKVGFMWLATVATTSLTGAQEGRLKILYGAGKVDWTNKLRFFSLLIQYPLQWALLCAGASLFSFSASLFAVYAFQRIKILQQFPVLWPEKQIESNRSIQIRKELISLIGRASVTYASGILVFNIQQPIIYSLIGPIGSAKLGLTSMVGSTLISLASLWGHTQFPSFAREIAQGSVSDALLNFRHTLLRTVAIATFGFFAGQMALWVLHHIPRFSERLMSVSEALPLFTAFWLQTIFLMLTYWPRSFKVEPFAPIAIIQMIVSPLAVWWLVSHLGVSGVGWANLISWIFGAVGISWITFGYLPSRQTAKDAIAKLRQSETLQL